ncbi:putative glutathione-specific gamma-glutamylcyclotransferase 2 [Pecten maximus]|uniref:putative glutathione-specific gamma-glutamylcyclotransferase 2 n=1 Tax=Pecten maximus TaxID=6579 RepID=UPI001458B03C|nr:putative glutathione-specific gamma-glutamylcyclotransferase 2 [Pecten maximus]
MDTLLDSLDSHDNNKVIWVFGYGSLMWNPNFNFERKLTGHINGSVRRFWQGNTTHRGTSTKPGRVATLAKQQQGCVWGVAFQIVGLAQIREGLDYLYTREAVLGGYEAFVTKFYPRDSDDLPVDVLVFTATSSSYLYLGPADVNVMADQIYSTSGQAGPNIDYVTSIADYVRKHIPEDNDDHLFSLDRALRHLISKHGNSRTLKRNCTVPMLKPGQIFCSNTETGHVSNTGTDYISKTDYSVYLENYKEINVDLLSKTKLTQPFGINTKRNVQMEIYKLQTVQA